MTICIGGSKHGKDIPMARDMLEVILAPPVKPLEQLFKDSEIKLPLNSLQRFVAKLAGIPDSVLRPLEPREYAREVYHRADYFVCGKRVAAYVLAGIDPASPQTVAEVELLVGMAGRSEPVDWRQYAEPCLPPDESVAADPSGAPGPSTST
jgi:hypothetical protein